MFLFIVSHIACGQEMGAAAIPEDRREDWAINPAVQRMLDESLTRFENIQIAHRVLGNPDFFGEDGRGKLYYYRLTNPWDNNFIEMASRVNSLTYLAGVRFRCGEDGVICEKSWDYIERRKINGFVTNTAGYRILPWLSPVENKMDIQVRQVAEKSEEGEDFNCLFYYHKDKQIDNKPPSAVRLKKHLIFDASDISAPELSLLDENGRGKKVAFKLSEKANRKFVAEFDGQQRVNVGLLLNNQLIFHGHMYVMIYNGPIEMMGPWTVEDAREIVLRMEGAVEARKKRDVGNSGKTEK